MDGSYLARKYREMDYDKHLRALSSMKSSIDSSAPRSFSHITKGGKKAALAEGELSQADRPRTPPLACWLTFSPSFARVRYGHTSFPSALLQSDSCTLRGRT